MTIKRRLKFELYGVLLNLHPVKITDNEAQLLHHLAVDDEVTDALERRQKRDYATMCRNAKPLKPKTGAAVQAMIEATRTRRDYGAGCAAAGCGCLGFRSKAGSLVYCRCSHLTHDHYKRKRT